MLMRMLVKVTLESIWLRAMSGNAAATTGYVGAAEGCEPDLSDTPLSQSFGLGVPAGPTKSKKKPAWKGRFLLNPEKASVVEVFPAAHFLPTVDDAAEQLGGLLGVVAG